MSALFVTNSLLSAGGQDGKIPPAHEPIRLHDSFYLARSRAQKKKKYNNDQSSYRTFFNITLLNISKFLYVGKRNKIKIATQTS